MKLLTILILMFSSLVFAETKGFVEIQKGRELYVEHSQAESGQPTVVLINGLTYSTRQWDVMTQFLSKRGIGVIRYDMQGMGQTLLKYAPILEVIKIGSQVEDLKQLLMTMKVPTPYNLVGLSYGGAVAIAYAAAYPKDINKLILMAPFTEPLKQQDDWIKSQIWLTRSVQPWNTASDDELYDFFLKEIVYTTYPQAEPSVLENPFKLEATFRLAQGVRKWKAVDAVRKLPENSVHLMIAGSDQYIPRELLTRFWSKVSPSAKESLIVVNSSEHKMPEAVPHFAAAWIDEVLKSNKLLKNGRSFEADPFTGLVKYNGGEFRLSGEKK